MRAAVFVALWLTFACGVYDAVPSMPEPRYRPMPRMVCAEYVERYCRDCHADGCFGWTVYETICNLEDCLRELEKCPAHWPPECGAAVEPYRFNDCD